MSTRRRRAGTQWYFRDGDVERGPFGEGELKQYISNGLLKPDTPVRSISMGDWAALSQTDLVRLIHIVERKKELAGDIKPRHITLKSVGGLSIWLVVSLCAYALMMLYVSVITVLAWSYATGIFAPQGDAYYSLLVVLGNLIGAAFALTFLSFLSCAFAFSFFYSYCLHNLKKIGAPEAASSPMEAWSWLFVPVAAWFQPYFVFREVWMGSMNNAEHNNHRPLLLGSWWFAWVIGNIGSFVYNIYSQINSGQRYQLTDFTLAEISMETIARIFLVIAALCLIRITLFTSAAQKQVRSQGGLSVFD